MLRTQDSLVLKNGEGRKRKDKILQHSRFRGGTKDWFYVCINALCIYIYFFLITGVQAILNGGMKQFNINVLDKITASCYHSMMKQISLENCHSI